MGVIATTSAVIAIITIISSGYHHNAAAGSIKTSSIIKPNGDNAKSIEDYGVRDKMAATSARGNLTKSGRSPGEYDDPKKDELVSGSGEPFNTSITSTTENQSFITKIFPSTFAPKTKINGNKTSKFYLIRNNNQTSVAAKKTVRTTSKITRKVSKVLSTTSNIQKLVKAVNTKKINDKTANNTPTAIPSVKPQRAAKFYLIREPVVKSTTGTKAQKTNLSKPQTSRTAVSTKAFATKPKIKSVTKNVLTKKHKPAAKLFDKPIIADRSINTEDKLDPKFNLMKDSLARSKPKISQSQNIITNPIEQHKLQNLNETSKTFVADPNFEISQSHSADIDDTNSQIYPVVMATEATIPLQSEQNKNELDITTGPVPIVRGGIRAFTKIDVSHHDMTNITNATTAEVENTSKIISGPAGNNSSDGTFITSILKIGTTKRKTRKRVRKIRRRIVKTIKAIQTKGLINSDQTVQTRTTDQ